MTNNSEANKTETPTASASPVDRLVMCGDKEDTDFYKDFYEQNRIAMLQYKSLRKHFNRMVENVLGEDYYNMAMDVYEADRICCEDVTRRANRSALARLLNT